MAEQAVSEKKYTDAMEHFHEFVTRVSDGKDLDAVITKLYKLFYSGKYEKIDAMYEKRYVKKLKGKEEKEEARSFLYVVFPEFERDKSGKIVVKSFLGETEGESVAEVEEG